MGRGCRKPDLTFDCRRSFLTQSWVLSYLKSSSVLRTAVNAMPVPLSEQPHCIAKLLAHTGTLLMMNFHLLCCLSHLSANSRSASISLPSLVSWEISYRRLWATLQSCFTIPKWEICRWALIHADVLLSDCSVFAGKLTPLDRDLVLSLWHSFWALNLHATFRSVTPSILCSALTSSQFSLKKINLTLLSSPPPLFVLAVYELEVLQGILAAQQKERHSHPSLLPLWLCRRISRALFCW